MTEELKQKYLQYLSEKINDQDYSDVDVFCVDNNVENDGTISELLDLQVKVVLI